MLKRVKSSHFKKSIEFVNSYDKDPGIDFSTLKNRGSAFEILSELLPELKNPKLVSSTYGKINSILLTMPSYVFESEDYKNPFTNIVNKLPKETNFIVLINEKSEHLFREWIGTNDLNGRVILVLAPDYLGFTVWAEDPYCIAQDQDSNNTFFIESASFNRLEDEYIADKVSEFTDLKLSLANVYFEGGNILIGDDFWLVGLDYPNRSFDYGYITQNENETKLEAIRRVYGNLLDKHRKLYPIGTHLPVPAEREMQIQINGETWTQKIFRGNEKGTTQPLFHIDMFITLLGKAENGKNLVMVGDPAMAIDTLGNIDFIETSKPFIMIDIFNDIASKLVKLGFQVIRNPLPPAYYADYKTSTIEWYFATSNNALVQITDSSKDIWIPQYGFGDFPELAKTDVQNKVILEQNGFTVHGLGDFHAFAYGLGAAHCITKYVKRED